MYIEPVKPEISHELRLAKKNQSWKEIEKYGKEDVYKKYKSNDLWKQAKFKDIKLAKI